MKKILFCLPMFFSAVLLHAQTKSETYYKANPIWIEMMESPTVNYFTAVKAFDLFWEGKEKPIEENDLFSATEHEKEEADFIQQRKANKNSDAAKYSFEYKKFKHWQQEVEPYVQNDGTILTREQRLELWKQNREGRK